MRKCYMFHIQYQEINPKTHSRLIYGEKSFWIYCPIDQLRYIVDADLEEESQKLNPDGWIQRKAYCPELARYIKDDEIWKE